MPRKPPPPKALKASNRGMIAAAGRRETNRETRQRRIDEALHLMADGQYHPDMPKLERDKLKHKLGTKWKCSIWTVGEIINAAGAVLNTINAPEIRALVVQNARDKLQSKDEKVSLAAGDQLARVYGLNKPPPLGATWDDAFLSSTSDWLRHPGGKHTDGYKLIMGAIKYWIEKCPPEVELMLTEAGWYKAVVTEGEPT